MEMILLVYDAESGTRTVLVNANQLIPRRY